MLQFKHERWYIRESEGPSDSVEDLLKVKKRVRTWSKDLKI